MGDNRESANLMLPTSRWIMKRGQARGRKQIGGPPSTVTSKNRKAEKGLSSLKGYIKYWLVFCNQLAEEAFRAGIALFYARQGYIIIMDRHYYADYYAYDIDPKNINRPLSSRIHSWWLTRVCPRPDLVICLDAPAAVLYARKPEGCLEDLERRREEYFRIPEMGGELVVVDANRHASEVEREVAKLILDLNNRHGQTGKHVKSNQM